MRYAKWWSAAALVCAAWMAPASAAAFCGFYVSGGDASLFNDATQVVLMRDGEHTILSMQNNYQGPTEDFAMVVPVPEILMEDDVKTLPVELMSKIDQLTAPRLVEYWEQDPCAQGRGFNNEALFESAAPPQAVDTSDDSDGGVVVEAEFSVGEYDIVILSAGDASALDVWLRDNQYNIPSGAEPLFKQYIEQGMYFFVAKVDKTKVTYEDGQAVLSPLRFHYTSQEFSLPVRLGMVNSAGEQDLIVYILGKNQRYDVANYANVTIPTNIEVSKRVREDFGTFYRKLFAETVAKNPSAVVTEYSWDASTCDPCPGPTLDSNDYATLGADVLSGEEPERGFGGWGSGWVITRLHARYDKDGLSDDLVFKAAEPIVGGREFYTDDGTLESRSAPGGVNNFQGRYIMRNRWTGPIECSDPQFGVWGGPPNDSDDIGRPLGAVSKNTERASDVSAPSGVLDKDVLEDLVREDIPEIDVIASNVPDGSTSSTRRSGCSSTEASGGALGLGALALLGLVGLRRRRD
ncbi:MAG: DUF2330 domain-containing protein [Myxococcota bacterium]